jgi:hypothetical protein
LLDELREAAARQWLALPGLGTKRLPSGRGEMNGMAPARDLDPDPKRVLRCAQADPAAPGSDTLIPLVTAAEPPRQELPRLKTFRTLSPTSRPGACASPAA